MPNSRLEPGPQLLLDETYREGFAELGKRGLSFEGWLYHPQIPELTDLARAFPETTIILNHLGGPIGIGPYAGHRDELRSSGASRLRSWRPARTCVAKVGGIQMVLNDVSHERDTAAPTSCRWYEYMEQFGPSRCMFESNFPVDKLSCGYTVLSVRLRASERQMFHDTALNVRAPPSARPRAAVRCNRVGRGGAYTGDGTSAERRARVVHGFRALLRFGLAQRGHRPEYLAGRR